ncbi:hypothetical protein [Natrinema sp. SYSU A 869]|uniref:hypothetical protein n=1 Tax=Natrinema sp. SYSU A 869 TaxID=2871694 RepID=UPI001CA40F5F|nr:hypothetical protein [Natrinema sp. SYSU A 869]
MWELGPDADEPEWQTVETPFSTDLFEVVNTAQGPYAVGDGGVLAADRGDGWEIVTDAGPNASQTNSGRSPLPMTISGSGSSVRAVLSAATMSKRVGVRLLVPEGENKHVGIIAVSGTAGSEKVLAGNGSGEILPFTIDGFDVNWDVVSKPAEQGATMTDLAADTEGYGYGIDTSGNVFKTTKDDSWERVGITNAQESSMASGVASMAESTLSREKVVCTDTTTPIRTGHPSRSPSKNHSTHSICTTTRWRSLGVADSCVSE